MHKPGRKLRILHIILTVNQTSAPYNEHCLPWAEKRDIAISTFFQSKTTPPDTITLYEGDGTIKGFFRGLRMALKDGEYDAIHVHSPHVGFLFLLATHLLFFLRYAPYTVVTVHDSYQNYKRRNQLLYLPIFASFRKVICCSQASYASFPAIYKWLAGDRLCYVQNGVDISRVDHVTAKIQQRQNQRRQFRIVAISRLVEIKNPYFTLDAFRKSADPDTFLTYIGDGHLRNALIERSKQIHVDNQVTFTGLIPRESVFEQLSNADLFISASLGEGLPIAVLESMACGCPVILSDIPPHREIAEDVDFIPLIHPEDVEGFAAEIRRFREMPNSERQEIGQKCRKLVEDCYSLSAMHAGYTEVYTQLNGNQAYELVEKIG
ncbi:MAG: glycosyltransferase family 4 protein [Anaerolineales bacterium]